MIQKGDFITLNYTGKLEDGRVFDTTVESTARSAGLMGTRHRFAPLTVCVGEGMLMRGLDAALIGKPLEKFSVHLNSESAFGKKDPKLLRMVPTPQLKAQQIVPRPGLELNIDGQYGVVRSTGGGRTVVDFNHPLANQNVTYDVEVLGRVDALDAQVRALLDGVGLPVVAVKAEGTNVIVTFTHLPPKPLLDLLHNRIKELTKAAAVSFEAGTKE